MFLVQPRQTGKSFGAYALERYLLNIGCTDTDINHFTKDDKLKVETITKIKAFNKELPPYLRMVSKGDSRNKESVDVVAINNKLLTHIMQPSTVSAINLGRGLSSPIMFFDEVGYFVNIFLTLPAALKATGAMVDIAKETGSPYGTVLMSTAAYLNTKHGEYAHSLFTAGLPFTEKLFDCKDIHELHKLISNNSRTLSNGKAKIKLVSVEFNHRQLGYTDNWLLDKMSNSLSDGENAETDYLNIWVTGTDTSPIRSELLQVMKDSVKEPSYVEITDSGFIIRWYVTEEEVKYIKSNKFVIVALDPSDAAGKDDMALVIRDVVSGKTLGVGVFNEVNIITFVEWLAELAIELVYSLFIIERRSTGSTIIDYLLKYLPTKGIDPFKKLFNWIIDEKDVYPKLFEDFNVPLNRRHSGSFEKYKNKFGYATSSGGKASRDNLYGKSLLPSVKYTGHVTHDKELVGQVSSLVIKNGRIDHIAGGNDDLVIAWLLSYWVLVYGRNLEYYGIKTRSIMSVVVSRLEENINSNDEESELYRAEQEDLKRRIEDFMDILSKEKNDNKAFILINKIKRMSSQLDKRMVVTFNIDHMLRDIEDVRLENKRKIIY